MVWADEVFGEGFEGRLWAEEELGFVRKQVHPVDDNLEIWNYTEKAVFDRHWNDVTLNTRGLVTYLHDGLEMSIEARPFQKFFNYGESGAAEISLSENVLVQDKMDGSLGILYQAPDGKPAIATRGSFQSDQALHGTKVLREKYSEWYEQWSGDNTFLFEIIYPENRIVCDYQGLDDLVFLGAISKKDGTFYWDDKSWPGPKTGIFGMETFQEALLRPPRDGAEGIVVTDPHGQKLKIKQEEYLRLHKIVTGLNARAIWEVLKAGEDVQAFIAELPDEFQEWALAVEATLTAEWMGIIDQITVTYQAVKEQVGDDAERKDFAKVATQTEYPWAMFAKLDGKDFLQKVWDLVKPSHIWTPHGTREFTEDTA